MGQLLDPNKPIPQIKSVEQLWGLIEDFSGDSGSDYIDHVFTSSRKNWLIGNLQYLSDMAGVTGLELFWGDQSCRYNWIIEEGEEGTAPWWTWNALIVTPTQIDKTITKIAAILEWSTTHIEKLKADEVMGHCGKDMLVDAVNSPVVTHDPTGDRVPYSDDGDSVSCLFSFLASMRQLMINALTTKRPLLYFVQTPYPNPNAQQYRRDLDEFSSKPRFFYGDATPVMVSDAVLFDNGRFPGLVPGLVKKLMISYDANRKPFPAAVLVDEGKPGQQLAIGLNKMTGGYFPELVLVERGSADFVQACAAWLQKKASAGEPEMQFNLGNLYVLGHRIAKDSGQGLFWWRKSAEAGYALAQYHLGLIISRGEGVPVDAAAAFAWWYKAAVQGNAAAQHAAGRAYSEGKGVAQDRVTGFAWYKKAAQQGLAAAQFSVGCCYEAGMGVSPDCALAVEWYRQGAQQGHGPSQCNLADKYEHGLGVKQDYAKAIEWYLKSAQRKNAPAMYSLGEMNFHGRGMPVNQMGATHWWREAAALGYHDAIQRLKELNLNP